MRGGKGRKMTRSSGPLGEFDYIPKQFFWKPPAKELTEDSETGWKKTSIRTGVLARKVGMSTDWNEWTRRYALTYLQLEDVVVVDHKTDARDGYNAAVIGFRKAKEKHLNKPQLGMFAKNNVEPRRFLREFRITPDAFPPIGAEITAKHFCPGQRINVRGKTKGKGFAGVMKRHHFKGGNASHGASKSHRQLGSTGAATDPAHVHKGKKMPGQLGNKFRTAQNLLVFRVVPELNMLAVVGHVPGPENGIVELWDSNKKWKEPVAPPPFPAYVRQPADVIKHYSEFEDGTEFIDLKGPMPLPWRLQVAKEAGWHIPSPEEIEEQAARGRVHQIATGIKDSFLASGGKGNSASNKLDEDDFDEDEDDEEDEK